MNQTDASKLAAVRAWLSVFIFSALAFGAAPCVIAEEPTPSFGEIVDVRVVNIEVVVTDGKNRVHGLSSRDFRLLVDGRETPIEYFTEVLGGRANAPTSTEEGAIPALAPGEQVPTRYLVFIDDSFSRKPRRNQALDGLVDQLGYLGPEDQMAIVAYDGDEIELLSSWTSSRPALERTLTQAQRRQAYGLRRRLGTEESLALGRARPAGFSSRVPRGSYAFYEAEKVIDAASATLRGFARPPGRKVMLLLAGDWPATGARTFDAYGFGLSGTDRALLRPLVDTANRLGYTLYPVDLQGLRNAGGSAEYGSAAAAELARRQDQERDWIEDSTLLHLANETGGQAFLDGANSTALRRTAEDTRSYYWLGFAPQWREDDGRHRIEVEVLRPGLKVRSRENFLDLSVESEVNMMVESAQMFELPVAGESDGLGVSFGPPSKGGFRKVIVPLRLEIPYDRITLLPSAAGLTAQLMLRVAVTDDEGNRADMPLIPIVLRPEEPPRSGEFAPFEVGLKMRKRPHRLLISVHDKSSNTLLSERAALSL